jgi:hypothetical protein
LPRAEYGKNELKFSQLVGQPGYSVFASWEKEGIDSTNKNKHKSDDENANKLNHVIASDNNGNVPTYTSLDSIARDILPVGWAETALRQVGSIEIKGIIGIHFDECLAEQGESKSRRYKLLEQHVNGSFLRPFAWTRSGDYDVK